MEVLYVEPGKEEEKAARWTQISQRHRASTVVPPRNTGHRIFAQSLKVDRLSRKTAVNTMSTGSEVGGLGSARAGTRPARTKDWLEDSETP